MKRCNLLIREYNFYEWNHIGALLDMFYIVLLCQELLQLTIFNNKILTIIIQIKIFIEFNCLDHLNITSLIPSKYIFMLLYG